MFRLTLKRGIVCLMDHTLVVQYNKTDLKRGGGGNGAVASSENLIRKVIWDKNTIFLVFVSLKYTINKD